MPAVIGCDAHKQFSVFVTIDGKGKTSPAVRVEHHGEDSIDFLHTLPPASEIALEATGHWYWMVDEMEKAGHRPHLANPTEAKKRMGKTNKTDALDAKGLAILLHNGTLPGNRRRDHKASTRSATNCVVTTFYTYPELTRPRLFRGGEQACSTPTTSATTGPTPWSSKTSSP